MTTAVEGPAWAQKGLDQRDGRYPLAVEAPVLGMVAMLMPGVSTLTDFARYYGLYWALADYAERQDLDGAVCQRILRRSEVLLALATKTHDPDGVTAHGADALQRGLNRGGSAWELAELGKTSYSPRNWGFWSQYGGPSDVLGTATTKDGAIRPARHACPEPVRQMFAPVFDAASRDTWPSSDLLPHLAQLSVGSLGGADAGALRELFTATRTGVHDPESWEITDLTRRATMRILLRAKQLSPGEPWSVALRQALAFGPGATEDPVLAGEDRALAWRGLLLRHYSVGAWRRLWAGLVDFVRDNGVTTRAQIHSWITDRLPPLSLRGWEAMLPELMDAAGHPAPGEQHVLDKGEGVLENLALLAIGARRRQSLDGLALEAFRGGKTVRNSILGPEWVGRRIGDNAARSLRDLGCDLVDDMLAQSRRVAFRKVQFQHGRMQVFSRLHERNDTFTATSREGSGNVGLRVDQLAGLAMQLGLADDAVTDLGCDLLELPR
ncbi:hypothetical protein [Pseudonocardia oroxyli]|uniref:Uncharacterized protein n=1 Tax=Pseudonocardia oroxyli TaxID=366584 RepID=A0A1G7ZQZ5_PSEOR|nr:hypothetical protein [Pseudonocardia oroxyli]SDH11182.1 hypothetical protein SAMN05216377_11916 [Pseudonocardia oroxyli]